MAGTIDPSAYRDAVVVLATAGVIVPFAKRFRVNSVVAFMACGAVLGPYGLGGLVATLGGVLFLVLVGIAWWRSHARVATPPEAEMTWRTT